MAIQYMPILFMGKPGCSAWVVNQNQSTDMKLCNGSSYNSPVLPSCPSRHLAWGISQGLARFWEQQITFLNLGTTDPRKAMGIPRAILPGL